MSQNEVKLCPSIPNGANLDPLFPLSGECSLCEADTVQRGSDPVLTFHRVTGLQTVNNNGEAPCWLPACRPGTSTHIKRACHQCQWNPLCAIYSKGNQYWGGPDRNVHVYILLLPRSGVNERGQSIWRPVGG